MKKTIIALAVACAALAGATSAFAATATVNKGVNFRADQSTSSKVYGLVPKGTELQVQAANNYWVLVSYNGKTGYVSRNYVTVHEDPVVIPKATAVINTGKTYLGVPYKFGAKAGSGYFDCSLFTQTAFGKNGITLPRNSRQQSQVGSYVSKSNLKAGDLVFFSTVATDKKSGVNRIGHVGIYIGDGMMIHTYGAGGVKITSINKEWWADHYITARRVL